MVAFHGGGGGEWSQKKKQGSSLAEVIADNPTAEFDAKWGGFLINGKTFASLLYAGV